MTANKKSSPSMGNIAKIVAIATLVSKLFGFVRELVVSAAFGLGAVKNAYAYAYTIPGFLFVLIGGINGPFHSALLSVLAKKDKSEAAPIVETVSTLVSILLIIITVGIIIFAGNLIGILGPELSAEVKQLATLQLRIMSPMALLAGLIGIGFGSLNAADSYLLPSISPLFSSAVITTGVAAVLWRFGEQLNTPQYFQIGAIVLASATVGGAILQWVAQLIVQWRAGMGTLKLRFKLTPEVVDVFKVMIPATLSSGMLYVNLNVDQFFVSGIDGAAAGLQNATFIFITPLGIISNAILVPFYPVFSRLAAPEHWRELKERIRQGIFLGALSMLPFTAIFMSLALPIIKLAFERGQFSADNTRFVASLLVVYGFGMFFYMGRDVLIRVFYALGDGETPFKVSIVNIFINATLDYFLVDAFGAPGLIMATVGVNIISMAVFVGILSRRLNGLPLINWSRGIAGLAIATILAGLASYSVSQGIERTIGNSNLFLLLVELSVASTVAMIIFGIVAMQLKLPELDMLTSRIRQRFGR
ncbi:MAG: murein biosynthesis integral membrane protein MurJ [Cyanobacteria bacterium P01_G01_bin.19]